MHIANLFIKCQKVLDNLMFKGSDGMVTNPLPPLLEIKFSTVGQRIFVLGGKKMNNCSLIDTEGYTHLRKVNILS